MQLLLPGGVCTKGCWCCAACVDGFTSDADYLNALTDGRQSIAFDHEGTLGLGFPCPNCFKLHPSTVPGCIWTGKIQVPTTARPRHHPAHPPYPPREPSRATWVSYPTQPRPSCAGQEANTKIQSPCRGAANCVCASCQVAGILLSARRVNTAVMERANPTHPSPPHPTTQPNPTTQHPTSP